MAKTVDTEKTAKKKSTNKTRTPRKMKTAPSSIPNPWDNVPFKTKYLNDCKKIHDLLISETASSISDLKKHGVPIGSIRYAFTKYYNGEISGFSLISENGRLYLKSK